MDEELVNVPPSTTGSASVGTDSPDRNEWSDVAAILWVPDPGSRRGWRDSFIYRQKPGERRRVGFWPKNR